MSIETILAVLKSAGKMDGPSLTELGKIKIGCLGEQRKSKDGKDFRMPQKLDHFVLTTMQRSKSGDLIQDDALMQSLLPDYGSEDGKLRRLPIRLLSDSLDEVLQVAFVWYVGKKLGAKSDGVTVKWYVDTATGQELKEPRIEPWKPEYLGLTNQRKDKIFKLHSTFNCVIASPNARWGGVYKYRTTSLISFKQLSSGLVNVQRLTGGILVGMPLELVVRPMQVNADGQLSTVYVCHVELVGPSLVAIQQQAIEQQRYKIEYKQQMLSLEKQYQSLLVDPGDETDPAEVENLQQEFHPEVEEATPPQLPVGRVALHRNGKHAEPVASEEDNQTTPAE